MKIRNGFVSNSSSSSFVVRAHEPKHHKKTGEFLKYISLITTAQERKLRDFGFHKTYAHSPHQVIDKADEQREEEQHVIESGYANYNYGYCVTCNQDEIFQFLLENKIPFVASEHYGHRHVFYDNKTDKVTVAMNFGVIFAMYGVVEGKETAVPVQTFTRKEYLKQVTY